MMLFGHVELGRRVPSCAVEQQDGVRARGDVAGDLVEVKLHRHRQVNELGAGDG